MQEGEGCTHGGRVNGRNRRAKVGEYGGKGQSEQGELGEGGGRILGGNGEEVGCGGVR